MVGQDRTMVGQGQTTVDGRNGQSRTRPDKVGQKVGSKVGRRMDSCWTDRLSMILEKSRTTSDKVGQNDKVDNGRTKSDNEGRTKSDNVDRVGQVGQSRTKSDRGRTKSDSVGQSGQTDRGRPMPAKLAKLDKAATVRHVNPKTYAFYQHNNSYFDLLDESQSLEC
jgi:hypothetical protein